MSNYMIDVRDAAVASIPGRGGFRPADGVHKVTIGEGKIVPSKDPEKAASAQISVTDAGGNQFSVSIYLGLKEHTFLKGVWRAVFESAGVLQQVLAIGEVSAAQALQLIAGKPAFVFVETAKPDVSGKKGYDKRQFITPEQYATAIAEAQTTPAGATAMTGASATSALNMFLG